MSEIRKLPASAGAEWLLSGFALLRKAPLGLSVLGVIWALAALLVMALSTLHPVMSTLGQLVMAVAGPVFFGGLVWAAREVDQGRAPQPAHLLQGLYEGRLPNLMAALLPQLVAGLVLGILLFTLIGTDGLHQLGAVVDKLNTLSQSGAQPTQEEMEAMAASLPTGRILLWLLCVVAVVIAVSLALFTFSPQVMFEHRNGLQALRQSLRACLRNLLPMAVFILLAIIAVFAVYFAVMIVAMLLNLVGGAMLGLFVAQLALMGVVMPVLAGAVYAAWRQLFGPASTPPPVPGDVFHA